MKTKKIMIIVVFLMLLIIMYPNETRAALQANGSTSKTDTLGNWLINIRQMEATGGTLGLNDTINGTSLLSESINNLDIHMEKNTEYGAMVILSASSYGNQKKIEDGETTTGNKSGVYINLNKEWVAAGNPTELARYVNANGKYKNVYSESYVAKNGDAISETAGWHGSGASDWINSTSTSGLLRAYSGSIFSYYGIWR